MTATTRPMTVGELSRRTGVSIKNLRQYTDDGLIYTVGRSPTGYRLYDSDALWCVRVIGELRGIGLTLAEIRELTAAYLDRTGRIREPALADLLRASRERLHTRIAELHDILHRIEEFEATRDADAHQPCWPGDPRCQIRA